jgi:oligopeptide/dipeptide ABC transporter ATP-binding protein
MCQRVMVMYLGHVMEIAGRDELFGSPLHPYSQALIGSVPEPDPDRPVTDAPVLEGELPSPMNPPSGCVFSTRCPRMIPHCISTRPVLEDAGAGRRVACHRWRE